MPEHPARPAPAAARSEEATPGMETRPYFVFGDLLANCVGGAIAGAVCALIFGPGWNMVVAMFIGMAIGMAITLPMAFGFGALFGAMEVMVPVMTSGMVAGMVVSMVASMRGISVSDGAVLGVQTGAACIVVIYVANVLIKGRAPKWTS